LTTYEGNIYAGIADMLLDMKVGGSRKAIIPGWLFSYDSYATEKEYLEKTTSSDAKIYEVKIKDFTTDIDKWEIDSIGRFFNNDKVLIDGIAANKLFTTEHGWTMTAADSVSKGFYYKQLKAPVDTTSFKADTTIYINYTGRLLNGQVFDTTIEDVAKDNNIWSSSRTYKPSQINWAGAEDNTYKGITMGSDDTSVISGFAMTLWQMRSMEKGIGVFYSPLGYSTSGSGETIPAYSPLIFEIEIVEKPEE
jgi:FKBP-type peptidyl-prolyl cis-trans isomerase